MFVPHLRLREINKCERGRAKRRAKDLKIKKSLPRNGMSIKNTAIRILCDNSRKTDLKRQKTTKAIKAQSGSTMKCQLR